MSKSIAPEGYPVIMPYLILPNAILFYEFVKEVFDAEEIQRHVTNENEIMHGEISIGGSRIMYGQASGQWKVQNSGLFIYVLNADVTFAKAITRGGKVVLELENKDYGRSGGILDPFGNTWWITSVR